MTLVTAFFTREEYAKFIEHGWQDHEVKTVEQNADGEEIIEVDINMTQQEFADTFFTPNQNQ